MRKLIAANWKENPANEKKALVLFRATVSAAKGCRAAVAVCPPYLYLEPLAALRRRKVAGKRAGPSAARRVALGAQDVFWEEKGAYTSEVGPSMLRSLGVKYAIVGHSERRRFEHETDAIVNRKVRRALSDGLTVILCVGEPPTVRRRGVVEAKRFVERQLKGGLSRIGTAGARRIIVAYEPIWAIGSGRSDTPVDAAEMAISIKAFSKKLLGVQRGVPVLYGGSVKGGNARGYLQLKEIDGALVGGASLKAEEFKKILKAI